MDPTPSAGAGADEAPGRVAGRFATTRWSLVLAAKGRGEPQAREALADLCALYWYPLYAYVRRRGHDADRAQDLTQEFFARLLEKDFLADVDRGKGRFRSFLLAACKHFLANERDRARALKRGGGREPIPIDALDAESRYRREPVDAMTPERLFDRRWALTLLDQVLQRLGEEMARAGKAVWFDRLKPALLGARGSDPYGQIAAELGMTEGAVKVAVHRLRQRYRALLNEEIARTVDDPGQVEDEIRDLFAAVGP
jgi:RNA polymerase sigma factor (sigma-70 family)